MATGLQETETLPPAHLDSDGAKFYEVVYEQIVENPPLGARQSILASFKIYVYDSPTQVRILQLGDELEGEGMIPGFKIPLSALFELEEETEASNPTE